MEINVAASVLRLDVPERASRRPRGPPLWPCPPMKASLPHVSPLVPAVASVGQLAATDLANSCPRTPGPICTTPTPTDNPLSPYPTVLIDGGTLDEARRKSSIQVPMATDRGPPAKHRTARKLSILSAQDMLQFLNLPPSCSPSPYLLGLHPPARYRSRSLCYMSQNRGPPSVRPRSACSLRPHHFPLTLHSRHRRNPYCSLGAQLPVQSTTTFIGAGLYNSMERPSEHA